MNDKLSPGKWIKGGLLTGVVAIAGLAMMIGTAKPATADGGFSFSISTNNFSIGYRSCPGGGYRYWNPGSFDRDHHWHDGYYSGPVVYLNGNDYRHSDRDYRDRDREHGNWNNDYRGDDRDRRDRDGGDRDNHDFGHWDGHDH
jgi:hypothetical protein